MFVSSRRSTAQGPRRALRFLQSQKLKKLSMMDAVSNDEKSDDIEKDAGVEDPIEGKYEVTHPEHSISNQVGGQPINSTEQEVIVGLLLAQGPAVYSSATSAAGGSVYLQQEAGTNTVTIVPAEIIQEGSEVEPEDRKPVIVDESNVQVSHDSEQVGATAAIMENVESSDNQEGSSDGYHAVGVTPKFEDAELVQSTVVASTTPGGTVYLEQQGVTLTELPEGAVQALPAGTAFEGATVSLPGTYVHQTSDGTSYVLTSEGSTYDPSTTVSMATISDSSTPLVTTTDTVDTGSMTLEQFANQVQHHAGSGDQEDHIFVLQEDPEANHQDQNGQTSTKKIYHCSIDGCDKQFSTSYRLKAHGRSHTGDTFRCDEENCDKSFITQSDLTKHVRTHSGEKPFRCEHEECGRVYTTAHHLKVHARAHTGEKPFKCSFDGCGKAFATGYGLKSHTRTHTGEKPYKCPTDDCGKAFKTSGDLQKHIRTHTGERPFKCPYEGCNRAFTTSNIRKVHIRTHTGERPYICEYPSCGRSFASATNFKNHSRIHTGERPYLCQVPGCNKRFTEYSSLYKHHVVHTHNKPYTCNICNKTYRQTSTLANHKRTAHGEITSEVDMEGDDYDDVEPSIKRQRLEFADAMQGNHSFQQAVPVVVADEASVAALQAMDADGSLAEMQQQITDGTSVSGHIAIPVAITTESGIHMTDPSSLEHAVVLSEAGQLASHNSLVETGNHDLELTPQVHVVTVPQTVVVTSLEGVTVTTQPHYPITVTGQVVGETVQNSHGDVTHQVSDHTEFTHVQIQGGHGDLSQKTITGSHVELTQIATLQGSQGQITEDGDEELGQGNPDEGEPAVQQDDLDEKPVVDPGLLSQIAREESGDETAAVAVSISDASQIPSTTVVYHA